MRAVMLGLAVAFCFSILPATTRADDVPQLFGTLNFQGTTGAVLVNGIPVAEFEADESTSGFQGVILSEWMSGGDNEIVLRVDTAVNNARSSLDITAETGSAPLLSLAQSEPGEASGTLNVEGIPDWTWISAQAMAEPDGLADAVAALHAAYGAGDLDTIIEVTGPFFADMKLMGGLSVEVFRERAGPMIAEGTLEPLPELTITSHADGRLHRVTGPEGNPPITIALDEDGLKTALRVGEWWSMIDGQWRVVR